MAAIFLAAMIKYSNKSNFKKERVILADSSRYWTVNIGKPRQQELEVCGSSVALPQGDDKELSSPGSS